MGPFASKIYIDHLERLGKKTCETLMVCSTLLSHIN